MFSFNTYVNVESMFLEQRMLHNANEVTGVAQVVIVQLEICVFNIRVLVDMVNSPSIERGITALDAVNDVTFI